MVSPVEQLDELAYVEQELEDLQNLIKQHFRAVEDLNGVQNKLSTVDQLKSTVKTTSRKTETALERLDKVQALLNERTDTLENRLKKLTNECTQLKQTMDQTMARCAEEWTKQQQSMQLYMEEFEARLQSDMSHAVNRLGEAGIASSVQRERLEKLDVRVRGLSNSVKRMGSTLKAWNAVAIGISVIGMIAIGVIGVFFIS
ncbi:MAG: hypothetical protein AAGE59_28260 [Cyanobacteria bacterium P01_F01_bin.86]